MMQKIKLVQQQNNSDEITHDFQKTEPEFLELMSFLHQIDGLTTRHWHCARCKDSIVTELLGYYEKQKSNKQDQT